MKRTALCMTCHYTVAAKKPGGKAASIAGPSCENCHGPASDWIEVHNDYGGTGVKREQETAEHKAERIKKSVSLGMIRPSAPFDVAANCSACHGLAKPDLGADDVKAMLDNEHPINPDFELVAYSQGSVRHRFYPPDVTVNQELDAAGKARVYVIGQAAALVSAAEAIGRIEHPKFAEVQKKRIATATEALKAIEGSVAEAGKLLAEPNADNARALAAALVGKDLTGTIGGRLPKEYK